MRRPLLWAAFGIALVPLIWQSVVMLREGFFWQDDFRYVARAVEAPLSTLFDDYNGHLMPGQFLLVWLVTAIAPLNFTVAALPVLALYGLAMWMFWRLLVRLFGARWELLAPFAAFTFSPLILVSTRWWAFALQLIPLLVAMIGAIDAQVRYVRTGKGLWAGLLWVFAGVLFWQKALVIVPVLVAVTALLSPEPGRLRWAFRTHWRSLTAHIALMLALGIGYALLSAGNVAAERSAAHEWVRLTARMIADTFLPGVLGGPWSVGIDGATAWSVPPLPVRIITWVLAAVIIGVGLRFGRDRAGLAWLTLAGYLALAVAAVGVARLSFIGEVIGGDPRYVADAVPVAILCACFAFLPLDQPSAEVLTKKHVALAAGVALLLAGSVATTVTATQRTDQQTARAYAQTLAQSLRDNTGVVVYDRPVPLELMSIWFGRNANVSELVRTMHGQGVRFDEPSDDMRIVDDQGRLRPLNVFPLAEGPQGPTPECGYLIGPNPVEIPLSKPVGSPRQVLRIGYFTGATGTGVLRVGDQQIPIRWESGVHNLHVVVENPFDKITLWSTQIPKGVCVGNIVAGAPMPG
ncbi:hypothetical protein Lesp02_56590 [Lentzea sp. NBRC 105346]|uniref:ArnT family glycosyltransferase n=1 Tax=Lentzea sp. NBRC 105346 TaxID=3032205 RepID=UPI0024A4E310|nr:hypothetical protein [Lentzea sp. NBRC 105346]GLZ33471.1 hypothetical protein Lesp02_56590 [Lentzea sp. NBRC 105346]